MVWLFCIKFQLSTSRHHRNSKNLYIHVHLLNSSSCQSQIISQSTICSTHTIQYKPLISSSTPSSRVLYKHKCKITDSLPLSSFFLKPWRSRKREKSDMQGHFESYQTQRHAKYLHMYVSTHIHTHTCMHTHTHAHTHT